MSAAKKLQTDLKNMVVTGNQFREVLQKLKKIFEHTDLFNSVINLYSQINLLANNQVSGELSKEEELRNIAQIRNRILILIDQIDEDTANLYELDDAIFKRLLIICPSESRKKYLSRLFPKNRYKAEVVFDYSQLPYPEQLVNSFDLILFDNVNSQQETNYSHNLLVHYIENTKPYVLYFGPALQILYQYTDQVYFSNSIFSIHARIEEMMTFLKYYDDSDQA